MITSRICEETALPFTCPHCEQAHLARLGDLESGQYTCPICFYDHTINKAVATGLRDEIEQSLAHLVASRSLNNSGMNNSGC